MKLSVGQGCRASKEWSQDLNPDWCVPRLETVKSHAQALQLPFCWGYIPNVYEGSGWGQGRREGTLV